MMFKWCLSHSCRKNIIPSHLANLLFPEHPKPTQTSEGMTGTPLYLQRPNLRRYSPGSLEIGLLPVIPSGPWCYFWWGGFLSDVSNEKEAFGCLGCKGGYTLVKHSLLKTVIFHCYVSLPKVYYLPFVTWFNISFFKQSVWWKVISFFLFVAHVALLKCSTCWKGRALEGFLSSSCFFLLLRADVVNPWEIYSSFAWNWSLLEIDQINLSWSQRSHSHTPGRYSGPFTNSLWRNFLLCGGVGKVGVSSLMWAKSLIIQLKHSSTLQEKARKEAKASWAKVAGWVSQMFVDIFRRIPAVWWVGCLKRDMFLGCPFYTFFSVWVFLMCNVFHTLPMYVFFWWIFLWDNSQSCGLAVIFYDGDISTYVFLLINSGFDTRWKFKSSPPEKLPKPNRKGSSSSHHFSGASC